MPTGTVHTLYLPGSELPAVGPSTTWLVAAERAELAMLRDERRRREWLAGRWAAKQLLVQAGMASGASDVEICSRDAVAAGEPAENSDRRASRWLARCRLRIRPKGRWRR